MNDVMFIILLYLIGSVLIITEFFLPAHGTIGLVGLGVLLFGLYETFQISQAAGLACLVGLAIALPAGLIFAIRNWHRTPIGRRISPPNPVLQADDRMPVEEYQQYVGQTGSAVTMLRPVGTCTFNGKRVECVAEYGVIDAGAVVEGVGMEDRSLRVRPVETTDAPNASA